MSVNQCPYFPLPDRPGISMDMEYLQCFREQALIPVRLEGAVPAFVSTRNVDIKKIMTDARFSREAWKGSMLYARDPATMPLLTCDPPLHTHRRRAVQADFTPLKAEQDRSHIQRIAEELVDAIDANQSSVDLIEVFARPFPYRVICDMVGLPWRDIDKFSPWVDAIMSIGRFTSDVVADAHKKMDEYVSEQIRIKQERLLSGVSVSDIIGHLLTASEEKRLSLTEITMILHEIIIAGSETTVNHLAMCIYEVVRKSDMAEALRRDPQKIPAAVEEFLRWIWLSPIVGVPRVALTDVELSGGMIKAGQVVVPLIGPGNRDPDAFADADDLQLDRAPNHHLGFGVGRHMCLGLAHARVELQIGLATVLRKFSRLQLAVPEEQLEWRSNMMIRGLWKLPVDLRI